MKNSGFCIVTRLALNVTTRDHPDYNDTLMSHYNVIMAIREGRDYRFIVADNVLAKEYAVVYYFLIVFCPLTTG